MMLQHIKKALSFFLLLLFCILIFATATTNGTRLILHIVAHYIPGQLTVTAPSGNLITGPKVNAFRYEDDEVTIVGNHISIHLAFHYLWKRIFAFKQVSADNLTIIIHPPEHTAAPATTVFSLPAILAVNRLSVKTLTLIPAVGATPITSQDILARMQPLHPTTQLAITAHKLKIPVSKENALYFPWLKAKMQRQHNSWEIDLQTQEQLFNKVSHTLKGSLTLLPSSLKINHALSNGLGGHTRITGQLEWSQDFTWRLAIASANLNLKQLNTHLPSKLNLALLVEGRHPPNNYHLAVNVKSLSGFYRKQPLYGHAQLTLEPAIVRVKPSEIHIGRANFSGQAQLNNAWQGNFTINIPALAEIDKGTTGKLNSRITLSGNQLLPQIKLTMHLQDLVHEKLSIQEINSTLETNLADYLLKLHGTHFAYGAHDISKFEVTSAGAKSHNTSHLALISTLGTLATTLEGQLLDNRWQGHIANSSYTLANITKWIQQQPSALQFAKDSFTLQPICFLANNAALCGQAKANAAKKYLSLKIDTQNFPLQIFAKALSSGIIDYPLSSKTHTMTLTKGTGVFRLDNQSLSAKVRSEFSDTQYLQAEIKLPQWDLQHPLRKSQELYGELNASIQSLDLAIPDFISTGGKLKTHIKFNGTIAKPNLTGKTYLHLSQLDIVPLKLTLHDIEAKAQSNPTDVIHFTARAYLQDKSIHLSGNSDFQKTSLKITGTDILIRNDHEYQIYATPDLRLNISDNTINIDGSVHIPKARIQPLDLSGNATTLPEDVTIVRSKPQDTTKWQILTDLNLTLGDDIVLNASGLHGFIQGSLRINKTPKQPFTGHGRLELLQGTYQAYGQNLQIRKGILTFNGRALDNPGLDIEAVTKVNTKIDLTHSGINNQLNSLSNLQTAKIRMPGATRNLVVGLKIYSSLQNPRVKLFSEPITLNQSDILSYLVFGKPADPEQLDATSLLSAAAALKLGTDDSLSLQQDLQKGLGLDEFSIENDSSPSTVQPNDSLENALGNRSLVVGKKLSSRLYVNYTVGLLKPINILKLRYQIGKNWTLETQSSSNHDSGIDLFYTFER